MLQGKVEKVLDCGKNGKSGKGSIYNSRYICNDRVSQCSPKSHSLKRRSSSSAPSGPISYGFDRIKLHQVQVMSPVLLVHLSLPSTTQVLEGIIQSVCALRLQSPRKTPVVCMTGKEMQDCKTMQHMQNPDAARLNHSLSDERLEKTRAMTRVTVHPSSMWLSQTVQLILWLVLSGWRRHNVLSVQSWWKPSYGFNRNEVKPFHRIVFSWLQAVGKNKSEQDTGTFNVLYIHRSYTHIISYMECTRGTAKNWWRKFQSRKTIGDVGCCEKPMAESNPLIDRTGGWSCVCWSGCNGCSGHLTHKCWM